METHIESLIAAAAKKDAQVPPPAIEVYRRLQFLAGLISQIPLTRQGSDLLLWYDLEGKAASICVGEAPVTIGRDSKCDLVLPLPRLSRRHARVGSLTGADEVEIEDLCSQNGSRVNGAALNPAQPRMLLDGDIIELGGHAFAFVKHREVNVLEM